MAADALSYCPRCATALVDRRVEGRMRRYCPDCDRPVYRNPRPCAGVLVVDGDEVVLIERADPPAAGTWSVPAGYLEVDEPPRAAAVRELAEETGLEVAPDDVELFETVFRRFEGRSVLVIVYVARRADVGGEPAAGSDAADAALRSPSAFAASNAGIEPGYERVIERAVAAIGG